MSYTGTQSIQSVIADIVRRIDSYVPNTGVVLESNPVPLPTVVPGTITNLAPQNAGSLANFIKGTMLANGAVEFFAGLNAAGAGDGGMSLLQGNRFTGKSRAASGATTDIYPIYTTFPGGLNYADFPTDFYIEISGGKKTVYIDDVKIWEQAWSETGDDRTYVALVGGGGSSFSNVSYGAVGGGIPLRVKSQKFLAGFVPEAIIDYTGSPFKIRVQVENSANGIIVPYEDVLYSSVAKGTVTCKGRTPMPNATAQYGGTIIVRWASYAANGTKVGETTQSIVMPSRPAQFGWNCNVMDIPYAGYRVFADLAIQGYWQRWPNGSVNTDAFGTPLEINAQRQMGHRNTSSDTSTSGSGANRMTWEQTDPASADATWELHTVEGQTSYSGLTKTGARQVDFNETFELSQGNSFGGINLTSFATGGNPKNIKIYPVGEDRTALFAAKYIELQRSVRGAKRYLDPSKANENAYDIIDWDDRTTPAKGLKWTRDGIPMEWKIASSNITNNDLYINIPASATDNYITKMARAIRYGENLSSGGAGKWEGGLKPGLQVYYELANEIWNGGAGMLGAFMNKYCQRTGATPVDPGTQGTLAFEYAQRETVYQHNRIMTLIEAAVPDFATTVVRVVASQGTNIGHYQSLKAKGIGHYDAHAISIYPALKAADIVGVPHTPDALLPIFRQHCEKELDDVQPIFAETKADGKRFILYEGGADFFEPTSGLTSAEVRALKSDPRFGEHMEYFYSRYATDYGDLFTQYTDLGSTWGVVPIEGSLHNYAYEALLKVQAAVSQG